MGPVVVVRNSGWGDLPWAGPQQPTPVTVAESFPLAVAEGFDWPNPNLAISRRPD